jgi:thiol:disulfide interchange protein
MLYIFFKFCIFKKKIVMKKHWIIRKVFLFTISLTLSFVVKADIVQPVKWEKSVRKINKTTFEVTFKANIDKGWHLYGLDIPEGGPYATSFNYSDSSIFSTIDKPVPSVQPERKYDETFAMDLEYFHGMVTFKQRLKTFKENPTISGYIEFMACDDSRCLPPSEIDFDFSFGKTAEAATDASSDLKNVAPLIQTQQLTVGNSDDDSSLQEPNESTSEAEINTASIGQTPIERELSLWEIFLKALSKGILAVFTPCVFPIIPLTVAFFMRDNSSGQRIFQAIFFGLSIVAIYAGVGLVAGIFQIDLTELTKNWIANLIIVAILLVFSASFFGMFELILPSRISNKLDNQVDKGGFLAPFFLALVTAIVSFSCVGPIAGVAIASALNGEIISPVIAMIGFSTAFAFPFVLIGIFPGLLKNMPKSGGWLNAVKVVFAFLMVLASYIFLGNTQWKIFNRDVILSLNIATFLLLGLYLLGKIKFAHDSDVSHIGVFRLFLAIIAFALAIYLFPGLLGSPVKAFAPLLPTQETSEFNLSGIVSSGFPVNSEDNQEICDEHPKYSDILHLPLNLKGYFDWDEALACAREVNKPVLVDFVGHTCKNCKKMYAEVWSDQRVRKKLAKDFVLLALYTDDPTKLPEDEWATSALDGRVKKTLGKKNLDFQINRYDSNALPMYVIIDPQGEILTKSKLYYTYSNNIDAFLDFLDEGLSKFKK